MIRLVYSNRTEELLEALAERVRAQQVAHGVLVPVPVVVPSAAVEGYVQLGIARVCGIAANLDTPLLTRFAADLVAAASGARMADAASLEAMALALLLDDTGLAAPELEPLRAYLQGAGNAPDAVDLRRVQLAARIGRLFEEYTYSRGDMLRAWSRGTVLGPAHAETEGWQRRLWLAMFGDEGLAARRPAGALPLVPLHEAVRSLALPAGLVAPAVHVFGFPHVSRTFHELLSRVAKVTEVFVYALSPCEGFWEDVDADDPPLLALWGRPGREQSRALNAMAGFDHDDRFIDPLAAGDPGATSGAAIHHLQSDLLHRAAAHRSGASQRAGAAREADESVVVLEHASVRREMEAVASEIWRLLEKDSTLRTDDFAVVVPDRDAGLYAPQVAAVFREAHALPCRMALAEPGPGPVAEAIGLLLALPLGRFTRQDLLRLMVHPAIVASLDDVDPQRFVAWCEALGVVHGADRADHDGTYIPGDILNWDQGLRRLALGSFMEGDAAGDRRPFQLGGHAYVVHDVSPSELRDAAAFGLLARSLIADAKFARDSVLSLSEWAIFLRAFVESYVVATQPGQEAALAIALRSLHALGDLDVGGRPVRYLVAAELARARLAGSRRSRGGEGVLVTTVSGLRPMPVRIVFACGMGEGRFPSAESEDPLDLRWAERREGDLTSRDRDKYGFLELLLGARDRLYVSYVSRDAVTGDALSPSSLVKDMMHALVPAYVADAAGLRRRHPLRRWDPQYFPDVFGAAGPAGRLGTMVLTEARAEARTLALRQSLGASGDRVDPAVVAARATGDAGWAALAAHLGMTALPAVAPALDGGIDLTMSALTKFLEFPLQGWARFRLGLDESEEDDVMAREDEPFETPARDETMLLREVLLEATSRGLDLERAYDEITRDRALRGRGPAGLFGRAERANHLEALETWSAQLRDRGVDPSSLRVHRFGRAGEHARADQVHDALALEVDVPDPRGVARLVRVRIAGRTSPLAADAGTSLALFKRAEEKKGDEWGRADRARASIRAFVQHAVLSASGVADERPHASLLVVATRDEPIAERVGFRALSRSEATVWLRGIVRDLLSGPHAYFFPCEAVLAWASKDPDGPLSPWIAEARSKLDDGDGPKALRSVYGPVPRPQDPELYPAPDESSARAMVVSRFAALLGGREESP